MRKLDIDIEDKFETTNIEKVNAFEQQINVKLPKNYVEFLLLYNGGRFKQEVYSMIEPIYGTSGVSEGGISWFYTLAEDYHYNLFKNYQTFKKRIPKELIPIGSDSCGNQICLAVGGDNYGKVYFWNHDWENDDDEQEPDYSNVYLIANNFTEFVNKLYEYNLEDED